MCLLTYFPGGILPDTEALLNGALINDDGHGFAICTQYRLLVQRGMHAEEMIEAFNAARHQHPGGPALFHSRLATHGNTGIANCHPFPIGGDTRTVMAHNGILPSVVLPGKGDTRSDSRITAEDFLPAFGSLRTRRARARLERWMTSDNKMVILNIDRRFRQQAYILNEDAGLWDRGIWYSNDGYLLRPRSRWAQEPGQRWGWRVDGTADWIERCGYCRATVDVDDFQCQQCGGCPSCGEVLQHCRCYMPAVQHHELDFSRRRGDERTEPESPITGSKPALQIGESTTSIASAAPSRLSRRTAHA